jgi:hypothetical protein
MHNTDPRMAICNSARFVRKGGELEHYYSEAEVPGSDNGGESRDAAAGQLTPKLA